MFRPAPRLVAVLGPTNTGKTHLAIERMLGHRSGMIGFPLRLLARENYDRIVKLRGARSVALITGEEKILPPNPSYFVCTVESMPLDRQVDFLAVDEIQLCADPERGHVFTARLLHARGLHETMFLGADTIKPLMRRLVPEIDYVSRPRFSTLSYTGYKKVTRLPPRSAVVAFAMSDVFSLAELIRRQRGGTAVVMGALSPRARNAQVGMFQAGEVDYLVATDAIGMGLNMDLDHVAFARTGKFDGRGPRRLTAAEIAQIAGRAGRHMSDGTFGTTAEQGPFEPEIVEAIETHRFDPLSRLQWRNTRLRFHSVAALLKSLDERPSVPGLVQAREADDHRALQALARNQEVAELATHPGAVRLLWEVCQIPDFRKVMTESHTRLLAHCYRHLAGPDERLPVDWIAGQMANLDRIDGDIDSLMARIAHVRTWTYITHRADWVEGAAEWQERARGDRGPAVGRAARKHHAALCRPAFGASGPAPRIRRRADDGSLEGGRGPDRRRLCRPARRVAFRSRCGRRGRDANIGCRSRPGAARRDRRPRPAIGGRGGRRLRDRRRRRAALARRRGRPHGGGRALADPAGGAAGGDFLEGEMRERVRRRLQDFLRGEIERRLAPLYRRSGLAAGRRRPGPRLPACRCAGCLPAAAVQALALDRQDRSALGRLGVRFGTETIYVEPLLRADAVRFRALLWALRRGSRPRRCPPRGVSPSRSKSIRRCRSRSMRRSGCVSSGAGDTAGPSGACGGGRAPPRAQRPLLGRRRACGDRRRRARRDARSAHRPSATER